ncbi:MAG: hypothetical protein ACI4MQ_03385 [Candidatus Coproplasma sp.]
MSRTVFIGHRKIFAKTLDKRLMDTITAEIQNGCRFFTMCTHGDFDTLALNICRKLRKDHPDIDIEVVITSLNAINSTVGNGCQSTYADVKTVMHNIEETHFKRQISLSNRQMIETCDTLICYVDEKAYKSGAKAALNYAKRKGLKIINLYREEDKPFYGMTAEEIKDNLNSLCKKILEKK